MPNLTRNIVANIRWFYAALGLLLAAIPFAFLLGGFNTRASVEAALISKEKIAATQRCEQDNDWLRGQVAASNEKYDAYRDAVSDRMREFVVVLDQQRRSIGTWHAKYEGSRGEAIKLKQELRALQSIGTYQDLWTRFHDQVEMPEPAQ